MSALLDEIINAAVDGKEALPDILRKCLLLGHELKNQRLKDWANQELNGYASAKDVPDYRIVPALARGNFFGAFHAQLHKHIIPSVVLEEKHRVFAQEVHLAQSVSAYQDMLKRSTETHGTIVFHWDPNMVGYYQSKLIPDFVCHAAWQEIAASTLAEVLDTIRNRTLNMALQIKDELGTSYTELRKIDSREKEASIQNIIFQNTGGSTNVAFGQGSVDASGQVQVAINQGDRRALDEILTKAGLDKSDLKSLTEAIQEDGEKKPGMKVGEWIKSNAGKVLSGGVKVGVSIGQQLLTEWLKQHYGIH
jgi:hypothetical protein